MYMSGEGNGTPLQYSCWKIPWMQEPGGLQPVGLRKVRHDWATSLSLFFQALEKEMATHSSVPAWRIPGTGEPRGLPSMGSHRVGHDWSDLAAAAVCICQGCVLNLPFPGLPCYVHKSVSHGVHQCPCSIPYLCINTQSLCISFWFTSFCIRGSKFIHLTTADSNSFLWLSSLSQCSGHGPSVYLPFSLIIRTQSYHYNMPLAT